MNEETEKNATDRNSSVTKVGKTEVSVSTSEIKVTIHS
ncbi:hypothetical protein F374_gp39 [Lactobacillus phage LF1]|uniref:Uncharacterized protein n=1 Tax=Lactobacillus phage LF1 TaxID=947980 RepID=E9LUL7_9CAUD|nr:hypothetical protein F374_gp39 [Lactobacillus phage LF1]ADW01263.1 hypothetical protein [Lactobacillus phage LF1]